MAHNSAIHALVKEAHRSRHKSKLEIKKIDVFVIATPSSASVGRKEDDYSYTSL